MAKYEKWLKPENLELIRLWKLNGYTNEEIAQDPDKIGVHPATLYEWQKRYPEIGEALKLGRSHYVADIVSSAKKQIMGFDYTEEVVVKDPSGGLTVRRVQKYQPPNATMTIFMLKNLDPEHFRDRRDTNISGELSVPVIFEGEDELEE